MNRILVSAEEGMPEPAWIDRVAPFLDKVLAEAGFDGEEISVLICGDAMIQRLNAEYRNMDSPTDVLSFENGSEYTDEEGNAWVQAGDIVVSLDTLGKNAEYFDVGLDEEFKRLLIHGALHLNGFDHGDEHVEKGVPPSCEMLRIQRRLMERFSAENIMGGSRNCGSPQPF